MLLAWLLVLSAEQAQLQTDRGGDAIAPSVKHCADGSVILVTESCPSMPDHRFEMTHEASRRTRMQQWWCGQSSRPSKASITIEQRQPATPRGRPTYVYRLNSLLVEGLPAPQALMQSVREKVAAAHRLYDIDGRCLFVRSGGTVPVLVLRREGRQQSIDIPLR